MQATMKIGRLPVRVVVGAAFFEHATQKRTYPTQEPVPKTRFFLEELVADGPLP
jgi:hypothetical protein